MRALAAGLGAVLAVVAITAAATAHPAATVSCPLASGNPSGGDVQWGFHVSGAPRGTHTGVRTTYTHGRGNWTRGRSTGKACITDTPTHGAVRDLVLSTAGKSKVKGRVHQGGFLGVRLVLPVKVLASDDAACSKGSKGTITLFASYYSVHYDTMKLHFGPGCKGHNLSYASPHLVVLITRHGAQVNTP